MLASEHIFNSNEMFFFSKILIKLISYQKFFFVIDENSKNENSKNVILRFKMLTNVFTSLKIVFIF